MTDLSHGYERRAINELIAKDVDTFCKDEFYEDPRTHLGASIIGNPCAAYAWNVFRWLKQEDTEGRMLRLFNRGHLEEKRVIRWLRGIGFDVREFSNEENQEQFRISGSNGHFGGSLDAMAMPPTRYNIFEPVLVEIKTHNEKYFKAIVKDGVKIAKPEHYGQMCAYGRSYGLKYGLYCPVNKNDDEIDWQIVDLDWNYADTLYRKADSVINSQRQPIKIAATKTFWKCKMCSMSPICHDKELPEKNCRSCKFAVPDKNSSWVCTNPVINAKRDFFEPMMSELIAKGCDKWQPIING